jgi:hypothetical protein
MSQMLFMNNIAVFQGDSAHSHKTVQSWCEEREDELNIYPASQHSHQI